MQLGISCPLMTSFTAGFYASNTTGSMLDSAKWINAFGHSFLLAIAATVSLKGGTRFSNLLSGLEIWQPLVDLLVPKWFVGCC